jgi:predicted transcriptional regulator of viral defense system
MKLYQIRDRAIKSTRAIFSVQQLANLIAKPKAVAKVYLGRLAKEGLATKIIRGRISFSDDDFVIATQLYEPSYVSFTSALHFHELINQVPNKVECVTTRNSRKYKRLGISYRKLPTSLFFGYSQIRKGDSYVMMADKEKAVLDMAYLNLMPKSFYEELKGELDKGALRAHLARFNGWRKKKLERFFR